MRGRCERVYGVSVEIVLKWGKVCWDAERCGGAHTLFYTFFTPLLTLTRHLFAHSPNTSPTHLTRLSTLSHIYLPHSLTLPHTPHIFPHTFPHFPPHSPHLTPPLHLHQYFPTLLHNPHALSNTSPYFIIYPVLKFLTFLIYCQISQMAIIA